MHCKSFIIFVILLRRLHSWNVFIKDVSRGKISGSCRVTTLRDCKDKIGKEPDFTCAPSLHLVGLNMT